MAKFQRNPGETMIGSGMMSLYLKQGLGRKPFQGNIYITNQRACFKISMMPGALDMDLPLEDIRGFSVSGAAFFTQVTIHSRTGETYSFTGFQNETDKNLAGNQRFSLFDHKEMYEPVLNRLKEIDPEAVKWRKYFWRRICEPDIR